LSESEFAEILELAEFGIFQNQFNCLNFKMGRFWEFSKSTQLSEFDNCQNLKNFYHQINRKKLNNKKF
jgi:hypothetical protein